MRKAAVAGACVALMASTAVAAPPRSSPSKAGPDVTISGVTVTAPRTRAERQALRRKAFDYIESHAAPAPAGLLPRWSDPVCPRVAGLPPAFDKFIGDRIKAIATSVGARAAGDACRPNVEVIFASDPQGAIASVADREPVLLGYHYAAQRKRLASFIGPVEAWYATATMSDKGEEVLDDPQVVEPSNPTGSSFVSVLIVVDGAKMAGFPVGEVAEELGMLALTKVQWPYRCGALPSILDLTAAGCRPDTRPTALTDADHAFLKALYDVNTGERLAWARSDIASRVAREIAPGR